jgi:hypothetical protein
MVREDDWRPLLREVNGRTEATGRQWAEVCFVPNKIGHSKKGPQYRYLATLEERTIKIHNHPQPASLMVDSK